MVRQRRVLLLGTVAALLGLQAPLCIVACLDSPNRVIAATPADVPPCHASSGETPRPAGSPEPAAPDSHVDCDCETSYVALAELQGDPKTGDALAYTALRVAERALDSPVLPAIFPREADLPPPDILLLTTTLII